MKRGVFVTGTDTGIGKTVVSSLLISALLKSCDEKIGYFKPIQTGLKEDDDSKTVLELSGLNPHQVPSPSYSFLEPMSPNRAAGLNQKEICLDKIDHDWSSLADGFWVVEGAGGVEVPLNDDSTMGDLILRMGLPALIVSSTRLGTINHTLMSINALKKRGVPLLGVVLVGKEDPGLKECLEEFSGIDVVSEVPQLEKINGETVSALGLEFFPHQKINFSSSSSKISSDDQSIWHPFTQHGLNLKELPVESARGSKIFLKGGHSLIDAISSWWVNLHGHSHPKIAEAISEQANRLEHVIFAGFTHEPAQKLARFLLEEVQKYNSEISKVFFTDNGSTAVEAALKMAFQYQVNRGQLKKNRFLALRGAYHGDTLGAMSVSDPKGYHQVFSSLMPKVDFVECNRVELLEDQISKKKDQYAAFILEPMIQGAGGMRMISKEFLIEVEKICRENEILLICDEIFTGFYRTGKFLAYEHTGIQPDLICLSKGITGGFLPLSVTLATEKVYSAFLSEDTSKAFLHGHSYTANPIACAAALASWELLQSDACQGRIRDISKWTQQRVQELENRPEIVSPRSLGTIGAVDIKGADHYFSGGFSREFRKKAFQRGVLLRPMGPVLYTVPPYCISYEEFHRVYDVIEEVLDELK